MRARNRTSIILILVALAVFLVHWPLDNYVSDAKTWPYRPPKGEGADFFRSVFQGGGGTPAIFAMLGGQRYMVANIMWNYADVLFHNGKPFQMVQPLQACVSLNPSFMEAWTTYGWHLAWNLPALETDVIKKEKWLAAGRKVYLRALEANPDKVSPYFDLGWLYIQRKRDYEAAIPYFKAIVDAPADDPEHPGKLLNANNQYNFRPITQDERKKAPPGSTNRDRWEPVSEGNRLAYCYRKQGVILFGESETAPPQEAKEKRAQSVEMLKNAVKIYQRMTTIDAKDTAAAQNAKEVGDHLTDKVWLQKEFDEEMKLRGTYGLSPLGAGF